MPALESDDPRDASQPSSDPGGMPSENILEGAFVPQQPPQAAPSPPANYSGGVRPPPAPPPGPARSFKIGEYTSLTGDPGQGAVPPGEYNVLESLMGEWEALVGYSVEPTTAQLLEMANKGLGVSMNLRDFGQFMATQDNAKEISQAMPWAGVGLSKDEYSSAAAIYGTTYKEITGSEIPPEALTQAFQNPRDRTGGYLTGSQYKNQLMNDAAIQKQFGWVKYGLDFSAWTQQKISMRSAFGRDINDSEAATMLQYHKAAAGPNMGAVGRAAGNQSQPPAAVGVAGSMAR